MRRGRSVPGATGDRGRWESRSCGVILAGCVLLGAVSICFAGDAEPPPSQSEAAPLLRNGDFEQPDAADTGRPAGWDQPDGSGIQWVEAPGDENRTSRGKAIRMDTAVTENQMVAQWKRVGITQWNNPKPSDDPVAAWYGLSYYSETIPVKSGQAYRISFDFRGPSGGAKVWVRGYGMLRGEKRRRYETIVNCRTAGAGWTAFSQVFSPTRVRPEVTEMRVMLYAYWPPGVYWFDNVRIEPAADEGEKGD